jgi:antitoxin HigA-1
LRGGNMEKIDIVIPGEILNEEFIKGFGISAYKLAKETNIPATRISDIIKGRRKITADTALRFSKYFGNSAEFWLNIQNEFELRKEKKVIEEELSKIRKIQKVG